ncbi:hypothetical protein J6590_056079 [Homalodisca vitripennis]|nr:hypothetical protein J6590_056079 [Homalodisca vitripennis]
MPSLGTLVRKWYKALHLGQVERWRHLTPSHQQRPPTLPNPRLPPNSTDPALCHPTSKCQIW